MFHQNRQDVPIITTQKDGDMFECVTFLIRPHFCILIHMYMHTGHPMNIELYPAERKFMENEENQISHSMQLIPGRLSEVNCLS